MESDGDEEGVIPASRGSSPAPGDEGGRDSDASSGDDAATSAAAQKAREQFRGLLSAASAHASAGTSSAPAQGQGGKGGPGGAGSAPGMKSNAEFRAMLEKPSGPSAGPGKAGGAGGGAEGTKTGAGTAASAAPGGDGGTAAEKAEQGEGGPSKPMRPVKLDSAFASWEKSTKVSVRGGVLRGGEVYWGERGNVRKACRGRGEGGGWGGVIGDGPGPERRVRVSDPRSISHRTARQKPIPFLRDWNIRNERLSLGA